MRQRRAGPYARYGLALHDSVSRENHLVVALAREDGASEPQNELFMWDDAVAEQGGRGRSRLVWT